MAQATIKREDFTTEPFFHADPLFRISRISIARRSVIYVRSGVSYEASIFCNGSYWEEYFSQGRYCPNSCMEHFRILASVSGVDELPSTFQSLQLLFLIVQAGDDFDLALEHIGLVRDQHPGGRIAIVADHDRPAELALAFRAGASGYFMNVNSCDAFIKSIELVAMGETVFPPAFLSFALDTKSDHGRKAARPDENERATFVTTDDTIAPQLSPREKSILRCLIEGD